MASIHQGDRALWVQPCEVVSKACPVAAARVSALLGRALVLPVWCRGDQDEGWMALASSLRRPD